MDCGLTDRQTMRADLATAMGWTFRDVGEHKGVSFRPDGHIASPPNPSENAADFVALVEWFRSQNRFSGRKIIIGNVGCAVSPDPFTEQVLLGFDGPLMPALTEAVWLALQEVKENGNG